jgi:hypothetical protein
MSANPTPLGGFMEPLPPDEESRDHAPEPWRQDGRYIRDASGAIVVRGRSAADARRIVAAINGTRGIPTEALEGWSVQDVSDPRSRPDFEVDFDETDEEEPSPYAVTPPNGREAERRHGDRRSADVTDPQALVIDRRVFERRGGERRRESKG